MLVVGEHRSDDPGVQEDRAGGEPEEEHRHHRDGGQADGVPGVRRGTRGRDAGVHLRGVSDREDHGALRVPASPQPRAHGVPADGVAMDEGAVRAGAGAALQQRHQGDEVLGA